MTSGGFFSSRDTSYSLGRTDWRFTRSASTKVIDLTSEANGGTFGRDIKSWRPAFRAAASGVLELYRPPLRPTEDRRTVNWRVFGAGAAAAVGGGAVAATAAAAAAGFPRGFFATTAGAGVGGTAGAGGGGEEDLGEEGFGGGGMFRSRAAFACV